MSGTDIFIAALSAVMLFGGLYFNFKSRKLSEQYAESHRAVNSVQKQAVSKNAKVQRRNA